MNCRREFNNSWPDKLSEGKDNRERKREVRTRNEEKGERKRKTHT